MAKQLGNTDGEMPMACHMPHDFEPCDECKSRGIGVIETDDAHETITGRLWLVHRDAFGGADSDTVHRAEENGGFLFIEQSVAEKFFPDKKGEKGCVS